MAETPPPATMTVTIAIPMLANIFQSVHNIEREVANLRADFSTRLEALQAQLADIQSPLNINDQPQDIADDTTFRHEDPIHQEEDRQMDDHLDRDHLAQQDDIIEEDEDVPTQEDVISRTEEDNIIHSLEDLFAYNHEDLFTKAQQHDVTQEGENIIQEDIRNQEKDAVTHTQQGRDSLARDDDQSVINSSFPSVDWPITVMAKPFVLAPAAGIKRKRTARDAPAYIDRSGFMIRSSDAQLAEKRNGEAKGPSRSESPFDNNDRHDSSDGVDEIPPKPPTGTHSSSSSKPKVRPRRSRAKEAGLDEFVAPVGESFTISRYGRIRNQTQPQPGFVATPATFK